MGDVVLGEKFPHSKFFDLPGRLQYKGLEVFLYSPIETLPILQNAPSILVFVWNRRGISSQLNL
jgi:hypothetical protein